MNWTVLILLSSFVTAGNSILDKRLMDGRSAHPLVCTTSFGVVGLPVALIGLLILPSIAWSEALLAITAGVLFVGAAWLYYSTISQEDISRLAPLLRLTAIQELLLAALFLGEALTPQQQIAFGITLVSSVVLSLKPDVKRRLTFSRAALRIILVTTLLAINGILMAHVYRETSIWHGKAWEYLGLIAGLGIVSIIVSSRRHTIWRSASRRTWSVLILEQILRLVTGLAPAWVIASGVPVALPSAVGGVRLIWVWLLAILFLKEPVKRNDLLLKGGGIIGMILGTYWLA